MFILLLIPIANSIDDTSMALVALEMWDIMYLVDGPLLDIIDPN